MDRRKFIKSAAGGLLAVALIPRAFASPNEVSEGTGGRALRYRICGSKKLGCSGFDFPDDPHILENGLFMPSM